VGAGREVREMRWRRRKGGGRYRGKGDVVYAQEYIHTLAVKLLLSFTNHIQYLLGGTVFLL